MDSFLELLNEVINTKEAQKAGFLDCCIDYYERAFGDCEHAIYYICAQNFELKTSKKISKNFADFLPVEITRKVIDSEDVSGTLAFRGEEFLFSKLLIRSSLFGVAISKSKKNFSAQEIQKHKTLTSVISYLIKDTELNDIYKMQLKAIQDAIIEKENAYKVIEKQKKKLLELDKTKNAFLANISHELRTPLNAIIGFSQALACKLFGELNQKQEEYIKDIQASGIHLLGMINEILDISKIEANAMKISPSEISPQRIIQDVINILSPLWEQKSIKVEFQDNCENNILADQQKFQQVLFNLLSNAIKFTQEHGKIVITSEKQGKNYILKVKDNGIGIEKKYHKKIFAKFTQVENIYSKTQSSTGLGLTITKEIVKLHKGTITLESEPNKGSAFIITLKGAVV